MNSGEQPTDETQSAPVQESQSSGTPVSSNSPSIGKKSKAPLPRLGPGPLSARGPLAARGLGVAKPASPAVSTDQLESHSQKKHSKPKNSGPKPKTDKPAPGVVPGSISSPTLTLPPSAAASTRSPLSSVKPGDSDDAFDPRIAAQQPTQKNSGDKSKQHPRPRLSGEKASAEDKFEPVRAAKIPVPNVRQGLSDDLEAELQASLAGADLDSFFESSAGLPARRQPLEEGARVHAQIIKMHDDSVYISLGGPDQGVVPAEHFVNAEPTPGMSIEVLVRGISREDGLYSCVLPNQALEVSDWDDIEEGSIVEAVVTGHNTGGLECKVGNVRAFMPISQVTEFRVEDLSEFVDQKMVCIVTEANERRGNLVLSRRAILERERKEKRDAQLEQIEAGDILEGTVRTVRDFGAFVDLGGLDGLIHVSKLSWERIKHPKDVIQEGQRVKVKIESIDKQTGKISLSYRDLLENPWDAAVASFAPGTIHKGTVTKVAAFGCFVRLATGVEGLVHISELANHRVSKVGAFVNEGDSVDVKVLTFDRDSQKIALSMKAAVAKPVDAPEEVVEEPDEQPREMAVKAYAGPLRGGNERESGGERFGLRW